VCRGFFDQGRDFLRVRDIGETIGGLLDRGGFTEVAGEALNGDFF